MIGAIIALEGARDENLYLPVAGGLYILTSLDCLDQTKHNVFEVREGQIREFPD